MVYRNGLCINTCIKADYMVRSVLNNVYLKCIKYLDSSEKRPNHISAWGLLTANEVRNNIGFKWVCKSYL